MFVCGRCCFQCLVCCLWFEYGSCSSCVARCSWLFSVVDYFSLVVRCLSFLLFVVRVCSCLSCCVIGCRWLSFVMCCMRSFVVVVCRLLCGVCRLLLFVARGRSLFVLSCCSEVCRLLLFIVVVVCLSLLLFVVGVCCILIVAACFLFVCFVAVCVVVVCCFLFLFVVCWFSFVVR